MLHLTNETLKKSIFRWLFETFDKLTRHDNDLRQKHNKKAAMVAAKKKSSANMAFERSKKKESQTEKERLMADSSSDDDEIIKEDEEVNNVPYEEYAPLTKLKTTVKNRILDLA